jgi:hypothetical protein
MNIEERAAYYEQHKDDEDLWGDTLEPPEPQTRRALRATVTVRLTAEESRLVREQAKRLGQTYSDVIRAAIRQVLQPHFNIELGGSATLVINSPAPLDFMPRVEMDSSLLPPRTTTATAGLEKSRVA